MIAIICGGRDYRLTDYDRALLDALPIATVYNGGAGGADEGGRTWARENGIECITVRANWKLYKKQAGPIRNAAMLKQALALARERGELLVAVAFPGGRGTQDMTYRSGRAGVPCLLVPRR